MRRISRSERRGMIVLGVLALALIIFSLLWRRQSATPTPLSPAGGDVFITVSDSTPAAMEGEERTHKSNRRSKGKKKFGRKKRKAGSSIQREAPRDPLSETIPMRDRSIHPN